MLVATTLVLLGLLAGITASQLRGLRLGGVIVVPLVAVYLLRSFGTFPVFILSIIAAYVSIGVIKQRLPLYGRQLFILSVLVGALVPVIVMELVALGLGDQRLRTSVEFVGSVLPGIAAYNFHRLSVEDRVLDAVLSLATVLALVVVGILLTIVVGLTPLANLLAPLLLSPESDIAIALGLTVDRPPLPVLASSRLTVGLVAVGMLLAELLRSRYGLRTAGLIVLPLVALIAFRNGHLLAVWLVTTAIAYAGIQLLNWVTLLYGRVLMAAGIIFGLLVTISFATVVPVRHGLLPFFTGILGGVAAYNVHVVPAAERRATVAVSVAILVVIGLAARLVILPPPSGVLYRVTGTHLAVGSVLCLPAAWELYKLERIRPTDSNALDSVTSDTEGW